MCGRFLSDAFLWLLLLTMVSVDDDPISRANTPKKTFDTENVISADERPMSKSMEKQNEKK